MSHRPSYITVLSLIIWRGRHWWGINLVLSYTAILKDVLHQCSLLQLPLHASFSLLRLRCHWSIFPCPRQAGSFPSTKLCIAHCSGGIHRWWHLKRAFKFACSRLSACWILLKSRSYRFAEYPIVFLLWGRVLESHPLKRWGTYACLILHSTTTVLIVASASGWTSFHHYWISNICCQVTV